VKQKEQTGVNESGGGRNSSVFEKKVVFKAAILVTSFLLLQRKITPKKSLSVILNLKGNAMVSKKLVNVRS